MGDTGDEARLLRIYLEDHAAGATAGVHRAQRLAEAEADSPEAATLAALAEDIAADLDALLALMETMGLRPSRVKSGLASVGEKVGALKPNGRLVDRSPLSTLVELEAMLMAVRGKRSLWETLQVAFPLPTPIELDGLIARADDQLDVLSSLHTAQVARTFAVRR